MALGGTGVKIDMRPVSSLLPHEETIPSHVERIMAELRRDGIQKDPIIIDQSSGAVLDGMHRLAAFAKLQIANAVCSALDYSSSSVGLHRWARAYSSASRSLTSEALLETGVTREIGISEAFDRLERREVGIAAFTGGKVQVPASKIDLRTAFEIVRKIDSVAQSSGWWRDFVPEDELDSSIRNPDNLVLLVQRLAKDEVVHAARSKKLFPCKTSMHTADPRPVAVNFPTNELDTVTGEELRKRIAESNGKLLPENSLYEGRRYKERLLLLNPR